MLLGKGFVVRKRREAHGEELSPFSGLLHVLDDLRNELLVLFLGILLVEDTVLALAHTTAAEEVLGVEAHAAVQKLTIVPADVTEEVHEVCFASYGFVDKLGVIVMSRIVRISHERGIRQVPAILQVHHLVAIQRVLAVDDRIPRTVLGVDGIHVLARSREFPLLEVLALLLIRRKLLLQKFLVLLLGVRNVLDAERRILQIDAAEAILAAVEVVPQLAIGAVTTVLQIPALVAALTVVTLIAEFTLLDAGAIATVLTVENAVGVEGILVLKSSEEQVAVAILNGEVAEVAVLAVHVVHVDTRYRCLELKKLLKERTGEVEVPAIGERIPLVAPPCTVLVDLRGLIRRVDGENVLPR